MIWQLDLFILTLIVLCALAAITVKDLLSSAIILGAYSFLMCLLWTEMGSVDVAFTEATVGAGVGTVFFIAAVYRTTRLVKLRKPGRSFYKGISLLASAAVGILLLSAVSDFPDWADPHSPANSHLSPYYITQSLEDTSVPNIVTSVLADYRGFDTMFETTVIFAAGIAVIAVLRRSRRKNGIVQCKQKTEADDRTYENTIIQSISRQMVPFMQLFALYVVAHGHHSPGGGFQGGVILGASFILLAISYDLKTVQRRMNEKWNLIIANMGILIYAGIGTLCMLLGANFLDYSSLSKVIPGSTEVTARSHGMLGIEIGVALTVMAIMVAIYINIASHGKHQRGL
jgi:multicomponent Na+:H+ antiporter subunit B